MSKENGIIGLEAGQLGFVTIKYGETQVNLFAPHEEQIEYELYKIARLTKSNIDELMETVRTRDSAIYGFAVDIDQFLKSKEEVRHFRVNPPRPTTQDFDRPYLLCGAEIRTYGGVINFVTSVKDVTCPKCLDICHRIAREF